MLLNCWGVLLEHLGGNEVSGGNAPLVQELHRSFDVAIHPALIMHVQSEQGGNSPG
jgi:hypothetical protein